MYRKMTFRMLIVVWPKDNINTLCPVALQDAVATHTSTNFSMFMNYGLENIEMKVLWLI